MHFETQLIHTLPTDPLTGAISVPIYQTSTFVQQAPGVNQGYDYSRSNNPTRAALEKLIAQLEGGDAGFAFGSGLAAIDAVIKLLSQGDEVLAVDDIYGGTFRIFDGIYRKFGIDVRYVDTSDPEAVSAAITPKTKFIWLETPTNPTLKISDIQRLAEVAHAHGALLVVDNTFASPALQRPLELGADIVVHSATKYIAGHSDVIAGLVVTQTAELSQQIKYNQNSSGAVLGPFDSWLTIRGLETLHLRIEKQCQNAFRIARFLETCPEVERVYYPGLGGVVSFSLKEDTIEAAHDFVTRTQFFKLAESLGGVKSLLCHPAQMTHASIPLEKRRQAGIKDSLIRLSCGIEYHADLLADLEQAFAAVNKTITA
ncbi:UNVERIFIED_CONTAM: hypothetical protein GTU68_029138 [Idotea baltica]|nr:hypothetical protein [Idotea baltica]